MTSRAISLASMPESPPLRLPCRFGRYRLTRLIATGGMAQIYLAKSFGAEGFVKRLVIKRLDPQLARSPYFTRLFVSEAKLLVTLNHGNIVPVFDFGRVGDDLFIAMEYVHGASLADLALGARGTGQRVDVPLAAYITAEICKGLDYAHRKLDEQGRPAGIIHRDIKPRNILVSSEGEVKIVDFGVAKLANRGELGGRRAGTIAYMSPEQAGGLPVDPRTDLFSAGLVLYELVTGGRAYAGESALEILEAARRASLPDVDVEIPPQVREIIRRATQLDPAGRYATAHEMEQELGEYLLVATRTDGSEAKDVASPPQRLSQLMSTLPLEDEPPDPAPAESESKAGSTEPDAAPWEDRTSGPHEFGDPPDLAMIRRAAETFHSEFMTRVLEGEAAGPAPLGWRRWRWRAAAIAVAALLAVALGGALLLGRRSGTPPGEAQAGGRDARTARPVDARTGHRPRPDAVARAEASAPDAAPVEDTEGEDEGPTAAPAKKPRRGGSGFLNLNTIPWSEVSIDGQPPRPTPLLHHRLAPGRHTILLVNRERGLRRTLSVRIRSGRTTLKVIKLR